MRRGGSVGEFAARPCSLDSLKLKRVGGDAETVSRDDSVDAEAFKSSLNRKPWILHDSYAAAASVQPCESAIPASASSSVLEAGPPPSFYPSQEEFNDALKYIETIRPTAEKYGMCRVVPPPPLSATPSSANHKLWKHRELPTSVQWQGKNRIPPDTTTLRAFMDRALDLRTKHFSSANPSVQDIEHEYWQVINHTLAQTIEVTNITDFGGKACEYFDRVESGWSMKDIPKSSRSLLQFDEDNSWSPQLRAGMCFSSVPWTVEAHHLYTLHYSHYGSPKIWYAVPGEQHYKMERGFPSSSYSGVAVSRCVQNPGEFIVIFPASYHMIMDCGFNVSETSRFAPLDWLPHGQNVVEMYHDLGRETVLSHDRILMAAASAAVRAIWENSLMLRANRENLMWVHACGKHGILTRALRSRVRWERSRRDCFCPPSISDGRMDAAADGCRLCCCVCGYDLYMSTARCSCRDDRHACLHHAGTMCSCPGNRRFRFRHTIRDLDELLQALEGRLSFVYRWARRHLALTLASSQDRRTPL